MQIVFGVDPTGFEPALHACQRRCATVTLRAQVHEKYYTLKNPFFQRDPLVDTRFGTHNVWAHRLYVLSIAYFQVLSSILSTVSFKI